MPYGLLANALLTTVTVVSVAEPLPMATVVLAFAGAWIVTSASGEEQA
jgi:hypothetical protein